MPFIHKQNTEGSYWGIWKIEENEEELINLLGAHYNPNKYENIKRLIKIKQSMAGEIALRGLLTDWQITDAEIVKNENGKPFLANNNIHISISHSNEFAAACIHQNQSIGIDIEEVTPRIQRLYKKYMNESEEMQSDLSDSSLTFYWCAKEAMYKMFNKTGIIFNEEIDIKIEDKCIYGSIAKESKSCKIKLLQFKFENYQLAVTY